MILWQAATIGQNRSFEFLLRITLKEISWFLHSLVQLPTLDIFQRVLSWLQALNIFVVPIIVVSYYALMLWKYLRVSFQLVLPIAWYSTAVLVLSACALTFGNVSPLPEEALETQKLIEPGWSTRNDIRKILGEPIILNDRYRIEVYRDTDAEWEVAVFPPVPYRFKQKIAS